MEKIINTAQTLALPVAIGGALFKIMHWPGANVLLIVGLSSVAITSFLKYTADKTIDGYLLGGSIALAAIGVLNKLMHWEYSEQMIGLAIAGAVIYGIRVVISRKPE